MFLIVRSSTGFKYNIRLCNQVGIIDADYANNPDNEGEIFFQLINLSPFDIYLHNHPVVIVYYNFIILIFQVF